MCMARPRPGWGWCQVRGLGAGLSCRGPPTRPAGLVELSLTVEAASKAEVASTASASRCLRGGVGPEGIFLAARSLPIPRGLRAEARRAQSSVAKRSFSPR